MELEGVYVPDGASISGVIESQKETRYFKGVQFSVILVPLVVLACSVAQSLTKVDSCSYSLSDGYVASNGHWQSNWCILHHYQRRELRECLNRWDQVLVIGGARAKEYSLLLGDQEKKVDFLMHPEVGDAVFQEYQHLVHVQLVESLVVLHQPEIFISSRKICEETVSSLINAQKELLSIKPLGLVIFILLESDIRTVESDECRSIARSIYLNLSIPSLVYLELSVPASTTSSISEGFNRILNAFCNSGSEDATCCAPGRGFPYSVRIATPLIVATLALYLGFYLVFASGATFALTPYLEARSFNLSGFFSLLHSVGSIAALLLYMQMTDRLDYFTRVSVVSQPILCGCVLLVLLVISFLTVKVTSKEVLPSDQCNECRGLMIMLLILMDYSGLLKESWSAPLLNSIIAGFLFLSGYCNFCSIWTKGNTSWKKLVQVLAKLNLFPLCVCASLGSRYSLYYLIPLLSLSYLLVFIFMVSWPSLQSSSDGLRSRLIWAKFLVLYLFLLLFPLLKTIMILGGLPFSNSEDSADLYHMIEENRFNTFWGILVAYLCLLIKFNYSSSVHQHQYYLRLGAVFLGVAMIVVHCILLQFQPLSFKLHSGILPIMSYLLLRNGIHPLHGYTSSFLREVGSMSVWLYVSHYHVLLANNGKGTLVLLPKLFTLNAVVVVVVFVLIFIVINSSLSALKQVKSLFL